MAQGYATNRSGWHRSAISKRSVPLRHTFAALDLGTNNCRLLIAKPDGDDFIVVDAFSRIVRLGEGVSKTGRISDAAIERAIAALKICADKLRRRGVYLSRAVATEACRRADNGPEFVARVHRETGIVLDIISPGEEAHLAVKGCHSLLEAGEGPALIFDIGGGSTELVALETGEWLSVPWGVVSLSEAESQGADESDRLASYERMRRLVATSLAGFTRPTTTIPPRLLGTSGTVTTLASVHLGLSSYRRDAVDGILVAAEDFRSVSQRLASLSIQERAKIPCIGPERADLVVAGCAILEAILDLWPAPRVGVADRGIREGILRGLMGYSV